MEIITTLLDLAPYIMDTIGLGGLGVYYRRTKRIVSELADVIGTIDDAMLDDKITKSELLEVIAETRDLSNAILSK